MVRPGCVTTSQGPCVCSSLCRRLRDRVYPRGRCAACSGRVAEAIRQVRPDGPPGKDPADTVPTPAGGASPQGPIARGAAWNLRSAGFHPLLGSFPQGNLGGQTQNGSEPIYAGSHKDCPVVPSTPAPSDRRATPDTQPETTRAFRLLRNHGQQHCAGSLPAGGAARLVGMAWSSARWEPTHLGEVPAIRAALAAAAADSLTFRVPYAKQRHYLRNRMR